MARETARQLEGLIAKIDKGIGGFQRFEEWERDAPDDIRQHAVREYGSMEGLYVWLLKAFLDLRDEIEAKLIFIKGNQDGTARRQ